MANRIFFFLILLTQLSAGLNSQTFNTPPPVPVRTMAEWEELESVVISWNGGSAGNAWLNILTEIVRAAKLECKVTLLCDSQNVVNSAKSYLTTNLIDINTNLEFLVVPNNTIWVRDYGPHCVYANQVDSLMLIDWIYNRVRIKDDAASNLLGQLHHLPVFATSTAPYDLVNTGGNFMSDGMGTAFASKLIFRNNDQIQNGEGSNPNDIFGTTNHTEASIDNIMAEYMGINRYIKMEELPFDGIHHIDMHMKLLDEETLLVGEYPANVSDGPQIEANLQYVLSNFKTSYGNDFKVVRIPMPPYNGGNYPPFGNALYPTYANALFVNKTVIMPKYNIPLDAVAQDTFEKYLPGYNIVQVDCNSIIGSGGAVHCITHEMGVQDPLLIWHSQLPCQDNSLVSTYNVSATLTHRSGISSAKIYYKTDLSAPWSQTDMQLSMLDTLNVWSGAIPGQAEGSTVYYYIEAIANNGKSITRPLTAPEGYWSFCVFQSSEVKESPEVTMEKVYPNPASAITVTPVYSNVKTEALISLSNVAGQKVATIFQGELSEGKSNFFFDARNFEPGLYFVEMKTSSGTKTQKVIIQ